MEDYLSYYGWHFSKKMCEWAVDGMYRKEGDKKKKINGLTKETVDSLLKQYGLTLTKDYGYDATYIANMCKADYYGTSVKGEEGLARFIYDTIEDPDGYEGMPLTRFYADCIGKGVPINWEDML